MLRTNVCWGMVWSSHRLFHHTTTVYGPVTPHLALDRYT